MSVRLTDRELATVLAALRYWQQDLADKADEGPISAEHFDTQTTPLTTEEIDHLCERLNCGQEEKESLAQLRVKQWISTGELSASCATVADILGQMAAGLDAACTHDIPGTVLFLGSDDRFYTVTVEAFVGECNPVFVKELVGEYVDELEGELGDCDTGNPEGRSRARAIRRQIADFNKRLARLPKEEGNTAENASPEVPRSETGFILPAECHSDDHIHEVAFDALAWFEQADLEEIVELARCGWGGDYPADAVAKFFEDTDERMAALLRHCESLQGLRAYEDISGFECHVEEEPALVWLRANRPEVYAGVRRELQQGDTDDAE